MLSVAWWMHVGCSAKDKVLVCGELDEFSVSCLAGLSKQVFLYHCPRGGIADVESVVEISHADIPEQVYDAIIINRLKLEPPISDDEVADLIDRCLTYRGVMCIYEVSPKLRSLLKHPLMLLHSKFGRMPAFNSLAVSGFPQVSRYRAISYEMNPHESFPPGRYHNNKNIFLLKEKVRRLMLRSFLARLFANSDIWVLRKTENADSLISDLLSQLKRLDIPWRGSDPGVIKIIYRGGKIIVSVTSDKGDKPEYIAIIALGETAIDQRDNEEFAINWLASKPGLAALLPALYVSSRFGRFRLYLMSEFDGITVDIDSNYLPRMTSNAFETICRYSGQSFEAEVCGELRDRLQAYTAILNDKFPEFREELSLISDCLASIDFDRFPVVFMHGDAKLENFILDENHGVIGIIDFELADIRGFALLDLFYLIAYNHLMIPSSRFDIVFRKLVDDDLRDYELEMIESYCRQFGIDEFQLEVLKLVFFMHHYAKRYWVRVKFSPSWQVFRESLEIANRLARRIQDLDASLHKNQ